MLSEILIIFVLSLINGIFSMSEIAVVSAKRARLEPLAKKGNLRAAQALLLSEHSTRFLSTVQIGITLISILQGTNAGKQTQTFLTYWISQISFLNQFADDISFVLVLMFITFISLVFGELVPKRIGMANAERIAMLVAIPMKFLSTITKPFIFLLTKTSELLLRFLRVQDNSNTVTEEEIKAMIDEGATAGTIDEIEQDIVQNVLLLGDQDVENLMTHRTELICFEEDDDLEEVLRVARQYPHYAYPVLKQDDPNKALGIIYIKDAVLASLDKSKNFDLRDLVEKVNIFPEVMPAYQALEQFQATRIHHGLVVDERGLIVGLVTLNDFFDALVGDVVEDELRDHGMKQREDGSWLVDASISWNVFLEILEMEDETYNNDDFHTVGGFILEQLKRLPDVGEKVQWRNLILEVIDMDETHIDKVWVSIDAQEEG